MTPPSPLYVVWSGFGFSRNCLGFFLESDRDGAFFGLLPSWGDCFTFRCVTPPMFFLMVGGFGLGCGF